MQLVKGSTRVTKTARRIVLMFQLYKQNIDPGDDGFLTFVSDYLERKEVNVEMSSYYDLYIHVRCAIQEYLRLGGKTPRNDR